MLEITEWVGKAALVSYTARDGRRRIAVIWSAGDNGWHTPSRNPGCHTYQTRSLANAVRYAAGTRGETFARATDARRMLRRDHGIE